jgi:DsbC/DsbD-like thiol-disulfide interchange protein
MRGCDSNPGFFAALIVGVVLPLCAAGAQAAGTPIPHGTLELIAEDQWVAPGHEFALGLHFQLEKGWHIYWINPGDSGEAPRVNWRLPAGLTAGEMEWPTPRRLGTSSIVDFGYEDAVMLIAPIHTEASLATKQPVQLGAEAKVLLCREMCIPVKALLSLSLLVKSQPPAVDARTRDLFAAARKSLPRPVPKTWKFRVDDANESLVLTANLGHPITQAVFFPIAESQIDNAAPQKLLPVMTGFRLRLRKSAQLRTPIERLKGVLVLAPDRSYVIDVPMGKAGAAIKQLRRGIYSAQSFEEGPQR